MKLTKSFVAVLLLLWSLTACTGESPLAPTPTPDEPTAVSPVPATPEQPATTPVEDDLATATPTADVSNETGIATIRNTTGHPITKSVLYFKKGPHPQALLDSVVKTLQPGATLRVPMPTFDLKCEEKLELQVDVAREDAANFPSNALPGLLAWGFPVAAGPTCPPPTCEPTTPEVKEVTVDVDWDDEVECPAPPVPNPYPDTCQQCFSQVRHVTYTDGCKEWTEHIPGIRTVGIECPPPPCDSCECNPELCPPPPPPCGDEGICHVSNKGYRGGNHNLQFSWKRKGEGHEEHLSCKFNPHDFISTKKDCDLEHYLQSACIPD